MAISSVSAASNAASAAYVRPKPVDSKNQAAVKDNKSEEAGGSLQAVHSVVAGALGLEDPKASKPPDTEKNDFYTAGKFLAAAGTIGTIISVLA